MLHPIDQKIKAIKTALKQSLDSGAAPVAAFDADGTLWSCDIGEMFFEHQIEHKLVELPSDPWGYYFNLLKTHGDGRGYLWLAQINAGKDLSTVQGWAKDCVRSHQNFPVFKEQQEIISFLKDENVEVFVVSASIKWAVEPAARIFFGIPEDHVLAIKTKVNDGLISTEQDGALTWKEGKVAAIQTAKNTQPPFFCSGNSGGDLALLEHATHHRLVIASAEKDHSNFKTERQMLKTAQERDWFAFDFVTG